MLAGFGQYRQFHAAFYLNIAPRNLIAPIDARKSAALERRRTSTSAFAK